MSRDEKFTDGALFQPGILVAGYESPEIIEAVEDGDRIIIDQDGNASVNYKSNEVRQDFLRHVNALKRA